MLGDSVMSGFNTLTKDAVNITLFSRRGYATGSSVFDARGVPKRTPKRIMANARTHLKNRLEPDD